MRVGLAYDPVGSLSRFALRGLDFRTSFFVTCPLTNPRMLWFCHSIAFAISASVAPSLRLMNSSTF